MGYSLDLFFNPDHIDEEFRCTICNDVIKDPIMIETCEHIFCTACINTWKKSSNICPIDRDPIVGFKAPIRAYMNMYNRFKLKCGFDGCGQTSNLEEIESHAESCDFNPEAIKACASNCGASIKMSEMKNHSCIEYLKEQVEKNQLEVQHLLIMETKRDSEMEQLKGEMKNYKELLEAKDKVIEKLNKQVESSLVNKIHLKKEDLALQAVKQFNIYVQEENKLDTFLNIYEKLHLRNAIVRCNKQSICDLLKAKMIENDPRGLLPMPHHNAIKWVWPVVWNSESSSTYNLVINYELPTKLEQYINRIPRDNGSKYKRVLILINIVSDQDRPFLETIQQTFNTYIPEMPSNLLDMI